MVDDGVYDSPGVHGDVRISTIQAGDNRISVIKPCYDERMSSIKKLPPGKRGNFDDSEFLDQDLVQSPFFENIDDL